MTVSRLRLRLVWLTLFAFAVQTGVVDFHHHVSRGKSIQSRALTAGMCRPSGEKSCPPLNDQDHDGCALCWATAIAATSLTPAVFTMPVPAETAGVRLRTFEPVQLRLSYRYIARARGPPAIAVG